LPDRLHAPPETRFYEFAGRDRWGGCRPERVSHDAGLTRAMHELATDPDLARAFARATTALAR
jgi:hypothetical protein